MPAAGSADALARAAASLLAVLAQAVRIRCLAADDVASDRRAAELAGRQPASQSLPAGDGAQPLQPEERASLGATGSKPAALSPAPVLLLFSGGVDSTLLAALAHQVTEFAETLAWDMCRSVFVSEACVFAGCWP